MSFLHCWDMCYLVQLHLILHQFALSHPGLNPSRFSHDTFCLCCSHDTCSFCCGKIYFADSSFFFFEKSEAIFPKFRFSPLGFSVLSQICIDVGLDTVFFISVGMKLKILSHSSLLVGLSKRLRFVPCHLVCCWLFCAFFKPVSRFRRLRFKYHPKTGHEHTALGPLFKEHLWPSHLTSLCLSSAHITGENNINASLTSFRYCEDQCTNRGDLLEYYSNRGHRR